MFSSRFIQNLHNDCSHIKNLHPLPILCPFSWIFSLDRLVDVQAGLSHRWRHMGYMWNCLSWLYMYTCKKGLCRARSPQGGGGYSDISIHTYARAIFGGSKFWIWSCCFLCCFCLLRWGVRKWRVWGYGDFVDICWGWTSQNWTIFRCHFYAF